MRLQNKNLEFDRSFVVVFIFKQWICFLFLLNCIRFICLLVLVTLFTPGRCFSSYSRQSLFSVKLCSAQKFMIGYNIIHIVTCVSVSNILGETNAKISIA